MKISDDFTDKIIKSEIIEVVPILEPKARTWCLLPYPGHKKGCPSYNDPVGHPKCPPTSKQFQEVYRMDRAIYAAYIVFDLLAQIEFMKSRMPNGSLKNWRCLLYWQPRLRKELGIRVKMWLANHPEYEEVNDQCPEGMGIYVLQTMKNAGVEILSPPKDTVTLVSLLAIPINKSKDEQLEIFK